MVQKQPSALWCDFDLRIEETLEFVEILTGKISEDLWSEISLIQKKKKK